MPAAAMPAARTIAVAASPGRRPAGVAGTVRLAAAVTARSGIATARVATPVATPVTLAVTSSRLARGPVTWPVVATWLPGVLTRLVAALPPGVLLPAAALPLLPGPRAPIAIPATASPVAVSVLVSSPPPSGPVRPIKVIATHKSSLWL